jgi:hypothetical protein
MFEAMSFGQHVLVWDSIVGHLWVVHDWKAGSILVWNMVHGSTAACSGIANRWCFDGSFPTRTLGGSWVVASTILFQEIQWVLEVSRTNHVLLCGIVRRTTLSTVHPPIISAEFLGSVLYMSCTAGPVSWAQSIHVSPRNSWDHRGTDSKTEGEKDWKAYIAGLINLSPVGN